MKNMNDIKVTVSKDFKIQLPTKMVQKMLLNEGDDLNIQFDAERFIDKCFVIEEDMESRMEKEEYFCIPLRLLKSAGMEGEDLQIILGNEELTVTTSSNIIRALPAEYIEALIEQQVDMNRIADCVAERINDNVLESEEESI